MENRKRTDYKMLGG